MNIFESLENLNISEKCFEDIINRVQYLIEEQPKYTINFPKTGRQDDHLQLFANEQTGSTSDYQPEKKKRTSRKATPRAPKTPQYKPGESPIEQAIKRQQEENNQNGSN